MIRGRSALFRGALLNTILRNDTFYFNQLGTFLERSDNTARILDVKYYVLLPHSELVGGDIDNAQWSAILRSVSALTAYHWVYRETLKPWLIADLLILNDSLPRSLASCYGNLVRNLDQIGVADGAPAVATIGVMGAVSSFSHAHRRGRLDMPIDDLAHLVGDWITQALTGRARVPAKECDD